MESDVRENVEKKSRLDFCPMCQGELVHGSVSVHASWMGAFLAGFSYQHLWFMNRTKEEVIIGSGKITKGSRCAQCGFVCIYKSKAPDFASPW